MPAVKTKTLRSAGAVAGIADYLLDAGHRNHREYQIHAPATAETGAAMAARIPSSGTVSVSLRRSIMGAIYDALEWSHARL